MSDVVRDTEIRMKAAYKAIIREHLPIIREMRQRTRSKAWTKISDAIFSLDSKRIPSSQIGKLVSEVEAELSAERAAPLVMTIFRMNASARKPRRLTRKPDTMMFGAPGRRATQQ